MLHCSDLLGVHTDTLPCLDDKAEVLDALDLEVTLVDVDLQASLLESLQDLSDLLPVIGEGTAGVDENVVNVRRAELVEVLL